MSGRTGYTDRFGIYHWLRQWTVCEETMRLAENGVCPVHRGDACLLVVVPLEDVHAKAEGRE